jgi:cbb3-type cytochrome c oxidase subunit III
MAAWPLLAGYTKGMLGYSQCERVTEQLEQAKAAKAQFRQKIAASDFAAINDDPELLRFALAGGEAAFGDNCAPCHGRGAQGAFGCPNLRDDSWLWGGTIEAIHQTIQHGIRANDPKTRTTQMPAFGRMGLLSARQINDAAEYVLSLCTPMTRRLPGVARKSSPPIARPATALKRRGTRRSARLTLPMSSGSIVETRRPSSRRSSAAVTA